MNGGQSHIVIDGAHHIDLASTDTLDFGRASTEDGIVGLDAQDMGISRLAGSVHMADAFWVVTNRSEGVPLHLDLDASGQFRTLPPGQRHLINEAVVIVVKGLRRMHRIDVLVDGDAASAATVRPRVDTEVLGSDLEFTEGELDSLTALYQGSSRSSPDETARPSPTTRQERCSGCLGRP